MRVTTDPSPLDRLDALIANDPEHILDAWLVTIERGQLRALIDGFKAAQWYIDCLENVQARKVVRGLDEAKHGYESSAAPLLSPTDEKEQT